MRQVGAPTLQARLETIRKRESAQRASLFSALPPPSLSAPFIYPANEIVGTRRRKQCKSLQVAIGCFREKVYYTLSESRALSSPIGNRYSGRSRGLSQMRQVVPYRRSLFRRSAMNCLSPYAHFAPYGCRLRQLSRSCCRRSLEDVNCEAKLLSQRGQSQADFALSVRFLIFYFLDFGVDPHTQ